MKQTIIMLQKEWLEMRRNFKWLWVPLVFLILGMQQPIVTYYLPQILDQLGGLPEGAVIEIPMPSPAEVLAETYGQFNLLGVLVIVLAFMGIVNTERNSGISEMIFVRPISFAQTIFSKWLAAFSLTVTALAAGIGIAWYYTHLLIGSVNPDVLLQSFSLYLLWFAFLVSLTICCSTLLNSQGAAAACTLLITILLVVISSIFDWLLPWSPGLLSTYGNGLLLTQALPLGEAWGAIICTTVLIVLVGWISAFNLKRSY